MFRNTYQSGILSLFYSCGSKPLSLWSKTVKSGYVKRITDEHIQSLVLEIVGTNVVSTYITCPAEAYCSLGIRLPILVILVKNLKKYFTFEVQIKHDLDKLGIIKFVPRCALPSKMSKFKFSDDCYTVPFVWDKGWNHLTFKMNDWCKQIFKTEFEETSALRIHGDIRLYRIYFTEYEMKTTELPPTYYLDVKTPVVE